MGIWLRLARACAECQSHEHLKEVILGASGFRKCDEVLTEIGQRYNVVRLVQNLYADDVGDWYQLVRQISQDIDRLLNVTLIVKQGCLAVTDPRMRLPYT